MFKRKQKEEKLQSLQLQLDFLYTLRNRHLIWADDIDDPKIARIHIEIIDLIIQTTNKYNHLLDMYKQHTQTDQ